MEELVINTDGKYNSPTNLWVWIDGYEKPYPYENSDVAQPRPVNYYETEAQWVAEEFPHHILFIWDGKE